MGAKTWMLAYAEGDVRNVLKSHPPLDRSAGAALAQELFPSARLEPLDDGELSFTCPPGDEICVGCFAGLSLIAAKAFAIDHPSRLPPAFLAAAKGRTVYLHAMHSVVDWFAYAIWVDRKLERSLSLSPESGILEDIGTRQSFEEPYWSGQHPAFDPGEEDGEYPFPFHPLDLGEAALLHLFGYQLEGPADPGHVRPEEIPLLRFKRKRRWKLW